MLVSKCLATKAAPDAAAIIKPLQFGVGVKGSCEAIVHSLRSTMINDTLIPKEHWHLLTNFDNGLHTRERKQLLEEVMVHFPQLYPWAVTCYGQHSHLKFRDHRLSSEAGVQQGDPLGPLFFALLLQPVLLKIQDVRGLSLNAWYLDDGNLAGATAALQAS